MLRLDMRCASFMASVMLIAPDSAAILPNALQAIEFCLQQLRRSIPLLRQHAHGSTTTFSHPNIQQTDWLSIAPKAKDMNHLSVRNQLFAIS